MKIACPRCAWEPTATSKWICDCRHVWNTFDTAGRCPACGRVHRTTQCLACRATSPHHDWYHGLPSVDALVEEAADVAPL